MNIFNELFTKQKQNIAYETKIKRIPNNMNL